MSITPFVKWAGGKRQIMDKLLEFKPKKFKHYFEPFVGGASIYLNINVPLSYINDISEDLTQLYMYIQSQDCIFFKFILSPMLNLIPFL